MKSCFGYVRVSTHKQGEGVSLDAQKEAIQSFADTNNIVIAEWFEEQQTAAKQGRPIFTRMLKLLLSGKAKGVVMHKIDRSARNFRDWAQIGELADAGIDVHFATESLDFRSRGGRLSADIQAVIAADYIRNLREEVKKGFNGRLKEGLYPLKAPLGYVDNGGGKPKTIDKERGPLIQEAFELYASGQHSIRSLVIEMQNRGLTSQNATPISKGSLEKVLDNPFYTGLVRVKTTGACYQGIHEPLIGASLFERVQAIKSGKAVKIVTRHRFTYRSLFQCRQCRRSMIPERQKGHVYYRCHSDKCPTNCIREEKLEGAIGALLQGIQLSAGDVEHITNAVEQWTADTDIASQIQGKKLQLAKLEKRLAKLTDALLDELIDETTYRERKQTLLLEQLQLQEQIAKITKTRPSPNMVARFLERMKNLAEHYHFAPPDEKREIVEIATSNRCVFGKKVFLEPSRWLLDTRNAFGVLRCAQLRTTPRTPACESETAAQDFAGNLELLEKLSKALVVSDFSDERLTSH